MRRDFLLAAVFAAVSLPALAQSDHIETATYSPFHRTNIVGVVGQPVTITFGRGEEVYRIIQSAKPKPDGSMEDAGWQAPAPETIKDQPLGNVVPLWPAEPGVSELTVITKLTADGSQKVYNFRLVARAAEAGAADQPDVIQNLIFTAAAAPAPAPPQVTIAARATGPARAGVKSHAQELRLAKDRLRTETLTSSAENCHYTAKGRHGSAIEPRCPMDNGEWTWLRFPGLSQKPAIYIVNSLGEERPPPQHSDGDFIVVQEIAPHFRLRLGPDVLDIINDKFDPVGRDPHTGTVVAGVVREVVEAKPPADQR